MSDDLTRLLAAIARAKQRFPALRLTQLIVNATNNNEPYNVTDAALIDALERYK